MSHMHKYMAPQFSLRVCIVFCGLLWSSSPFAQPVKIASSSSVYPLSNALLKELAKAQQVDGKYQLREPGATNDFSAFCADQVEVVDTALPIPRSAMIACEKTGVKFIELPVAMDSIAVVVNPQNIFVKKASFEELRKIWEPAGEATLRNWNQVNSRWAEQPIKLYAPVMTDGAFQFFTAAVVGKAGSARGDITTSAEPEMLAAGVARDRSALGFFSYVHYRANRNKLTAISISASGDSAGVLPSEQTVADGSYPLSRPLFLYVNAASAAKPEVKTFVGFYLRNVERVAKDFGYVPLQAAQYKRVIERFETGKTGTVFKGEPAVGVKLGDVLNGG